MVAGRKKVLLMVVVLLLALAAGCGTGRKTQTQPGEPALDRAVAPPKMAEEAQSSVDPDGGLAGSTQRVIRNAELSLDVEDMDRALAELEAAARRAGGFVAHSSLSGRKGENRFASLTLRVPEARFDTFIEEAAALGRLNFRNTYTQDVTRQYIDLEARIRNLEHQEKRLLTILEKAQTIEDILHVERELERVRGQLEALTAEFRFLRDRVEYSTVTITLRETPMASPVITGSGLKGVWSRGIAGLVNTVNAMLGGFGNFLVFLLTALPYLLLAVVILLPAALAVRRFRGKTPPPAV